MAHEEQIAKLPKWARDHIRQIERERDTAKEAVRILNEGSEHAKMFFDPNDEFPLPIGEGSPYDTVRIYPHEDQPQKWVDVTISRNLLEPGIQIRSDASLRIASNATNTITVDIRDQRFVKGEHA